MNEFESAEALENQVGVPEVSFSQTNQPLVFIADRILFLPVPESLQGITFSNSRIEYPKLKPLTIPKNSKGSARLPAPKNAKDVLILPWMTNVILGRFGIAYIRYRFTIKFIKYIQNPNNGVKSIVSDNPESQNVLSFYNEDPVNLANLETALADVDSSFLGELGKIEYKVFPKGTKRVGAKHAADLIQKAKTYIDRRIDAFLRQGRRSVLKNAGFKEASILDNLKTSEVGYNLIKKYEKFVPKLYSNDGGGGGGNCTIGYGHLIHEGPCTPADFARYGNGISLPEAEATLRTDAEIVEDTIRRNVKVSLSQNQFDGLVSFLFTLGEGSFKSSRLLGFLNAGDFNSVPIEMRKFIYSNGKLANGLVPRREEEAQLFSGK